MLTSLVLRLRALFARDRLDRDLTDELAFHLAMRESQLRESGVDAATAPAAARRRFGHVTEVRETMRDLWGFPSVEALWRDLRYGVRTLRKAPQFALVAALTIGIGIGANATVFSVVNAVLLRPLPFAHADRLVRIFSIVNGAPVGPSVNDMRDFAAESHSFDVITAYDTWRKNVSTTAGADQPEQTWMGLVPAEYFAALGVAPIEGRVFTAGENVFGNHRVVILTRAYRQGHFAPNAPVVGTTLRINDEPVTVIGVMRDAIPDWMETSSVPRVEMWMPFVTDARQWTEVQRRERGYSTIARLKPGVSIAAATEDLRQIARRLGQRYPVDRGVDVMVRPLADTRAGSLRPTLALLTAAVAMILALACANVASLLLARNTARQREMIVRASLGASRGSLIRQLLAESLALAVAGGIVGIALAWGATAALVTLHPDSLPQLADVTLDTTVLLYTLAVTAGTSVLCGALPALAATRVELATAMRQDARAGTGARTRQIRQQALVAGQIACCVVLVIWTGLLVRSLVQLERQEKGFRPDHLLVAHVSLPGVRYPDPASITRFCDAFGDRLRALPGIRAAAITTIFPPTDRWTRPFTIDGQIVSRLQGVPSARFGVVDDYYRPTAGMPLLAGRDFAASDLPTGAPVVLINHQLVQRYFGARNPIGQRLALYAPNMGLQDDTLPFVVTVIGVIGDTKNRGLALAPDPEIIGLYRQMPDVNYWSKNILVRTAVDPEQATTAIRQALRAIDPDLPLAEVATIDAQFARQTTERRLSTGMLGLFTACGVLLAVIGIYGVVSYYVTQRTKEIGVRVSLGARDQDILWLVVGQGMRLTGVGVGIGLGVAIVARQALATFVFGVTTTDPVTLAAVPVTIALVALVACYLPARRAMRLDPVRALRAE